MSGVLRARPRSDARDKQCRDHKAGHVSLRRGSRRPCEALQRPRRQEAAAAKPQGSRRQGRTSSAFSRTPPRPRQSAAAPSSAWPARSGSGYVLTAPGRGLTSRQPHSLHVARRPLARAVRRHHHLPGGRAYG